MGSRSIRREAERLAASGDLFGAISLVHGAIRRRPDRDLERLELELRHRAFDAYEHVDGAPSSWPTVHDHRFAASHDIPEIGADDLDVGALRAGVFGKGALVVRKLFDETTVRSLREAVRATFRAYDRSDHGDRARRRDDWLSPHQLASTPEQRRDDRRWVRKASGVLAADSPRALWRLLEATQTTGVDRVLHEFFGERPALSVLKTTLRIVRPGRAVDRGWHQDGAFLGADVRSLNMWIALSDCGRNAPTLQMLPRRLDSVLGSGGADAAFSWSMSTADVERLAGANGTQWLEFAAGDAIFFDHLNLHSTAIDENMTEERLAIEAWFFAPSVFPYDRIPILV